MSYMFDGCSPLKELNISNFNINNVTDGSYMFNECKLLNELNISIFNISYVTNIKYMFHECSSLKKLNTPYPQLITQSLKIKKFLDFWKGEFQAVKIKDIFKLLEYLFIKEVKS